MRASLARPGWCLVAGLFATTGCRVPAVCDVLAAEAGAEAGRFAAYFPVAEGGAVLVFRGDPAQVLGRVDAWGLVGVRVESCAGELVVWFPGVDDRAASQLASGLVEGGVTAAIRERHVFAPVDAVSAPPRRRR